MLLNINKWLHTVVRRGPFIGFQLSCFFALGGVLGFFTALLIAGPPAVASDTSGAAFNDLFFIVAACIGGLAVSFVGFFCGRAAPEDAKDSSAEAVNDLLTGKREVSSGPRLGWLARQRSGNLLGVAIVLAAGIGVASLWPSKNRIWLLVMLRQDLEGFALAGYDLSNINLVGANLRGADLKDADLANTDLGGAELRGARLSSADMENAYLRSADLSDADLAGSNLKGVDLRGATGVMQTAEGFVAGSFGKPLFMPGDQACDIVGPGRILRHVNLAGCDLENADLSNANLFAANLEGAKLTEADLRNANLSQANLAMANLTGADLRGVDFTGAVLSGIALANADLSGANLEEADLSGIALANADLSGAVLSGANLSGIDLTDADLTGADLSNANLSNAILRGVDLEGGNLFEADLRHADLVKANLVKVKFLMADLEGANLEEAKLQGVDLSDANLVRANLSKTNLRNARFGLGLIRIRQLEEEIAGCEEKLKHAGNKVTQAEKDLKIKRHKLSLSVLEVHQAKIDLDRVSSPEYARGKSQSDIVDAVIEAQRLVKFYESEYDIKFELTKGAIAALDTAKARQAKAKVGLPKLQEIERWLTARGDNETFGAYLAEVILQGADLSGANLRGAYISRVSLRGATLQGADLVGANLRGADLLDADLSRTKLWRADLREADLSSANLSRADLRGADLSNADLSSADLRYADLRGSELNQTVLLRAYLQATKVAGATGLELTGTSGIPDETD